MDLIRRKQPNILLHRVNFGEKTISIPVAQLGSEGEKTVVITAGVDGDEYAGIEAAYALIDRYTKQKTTFRLIIIPIVNIPGFTNGVSWNPLDNKYPKHIFPGKEKGSATDKLMYWLSNNFVTGCDLWIDLHSGASTEYLEPFVQVWETEKKVLNQQIKDLLSKVKAKTIVFSSGAHKALVKNNCMYIRLESGCLGKREKKAIKQHTEWVKQLLSFSKAKKTGKKQVWKEVREFLAVQEGIWVPLFLGKSVKKGVILGEVRSLDGKILQKISAKEAGVFLWRKEAMAAKKGDSVYAYAHKSAYITKE